MAKFQVLHATTERGFGSRRLRRALATRASPAQLPSEVRACPLAFAYALPSAWNALPLSPWQTPTDPSRPCLSIHFLVSNVMRHSGEPGRWGRSVTWVPDGRGDAEACRRGWQEPVPVPGTVSDAATRPRAGLGGTVHPGPQGSAEGPAPRQGGWAVAPLWHRDLFADFRPQLIILMGLNGPECSASLDRTHLEPEWAGPADSQWADLSTTLRESKAAFPFVARGPETSQGSVWVGAQGQHPQSS